MRLLLATVVLAVSLVAGSQAAAFPHFPPPKPGDEITVSDEPPGENCEFGGIKVEVTSYDRPEPEPVAPARDGEENGIIIEPVPTVETFYVCNGAPGENGEPGPPGPAGPALPIDISQNTEVNVNINLDGNRRCRSVRERVRLTLPQRMRAEDAVRVKVDRERAISHEVIRDRFVRVNMRGKRCGAHLVQVRKAGIDPSLRLWTVTSPTGINKRVLVL